MKKKVILSSIVTIALCLCLIAGSTYALFTSQSQVDISVKAAKVEMTAYLSDLKLQSVKADSKGIITDEFGGKYSYVDCQDTFTNGGTATLDKATLKLDRVTPGDKVSFNIQGANTSDVTVQYRYIIECVGGEKLMSVMLVTVGETTYPILSSYTSTWKMLPAGSDIDAVHVVIELPVTAGNEYQEQTTEIKVTVEAIQGNADVKGTKPVVKFLDGYTADLDEQIITDAVINYDKVDIENGTIALDSVAIENYGELTMSNVVVDGGTPGTIAYGYGIIGREGSVTVLNDIELKSANGAIGVVDGGELTFNGGYVEVDSKSTSGRYLFYLEGEGTVVTINDGEFFFNKTQNQKRAYAYVGAGATLYITGGTFGTASSRSGYTDGILTENSDAKVVITGGTFGFNPSKWLAPGYKAVKDGANWVVTPMGTDSASLNEAIANGETYIVVAPGNYSLPTTDSDITLVGGRDTVITINKPKANKITIQGVTVVGSGNYTGIQHSDTVVYENCLIKGVQFLYANKVVFNNCTFDLTEKADYIWTYGAKDVEFNNCTFNTAGKAILIYTEAASHVTNVSVKGCTFNATASALAGGNVAAAIEIDSSLSKNGHYTLVTENNTVDSDFCGEWRIKKSGSNNTTVNGTVYNAVTIDGKVVAYTAAELQKVLEAATDGLTVYLAKDIEGNVTVTQKADVRVTIDGNGNTLAGVITVDGKSATLLSAGLTIKNVVFKADSITADACIRLGDGTNATRYTCNVTVENCTFDVPGAVGVKSYTGGDKNLTITGCTATANAHSLGQLKGIDGVLVENCTVEAVRGINLNNSNNVTITGSTFDVQKYAVRFGESANTTVETYAVTNCTLISQCVDGDAVIVLRAGATNANLTLTGTTLTGTVEMTGHEGANIIR